MSFTLILQNTCNGFCIFFIVFCIFGILLRIGNPRSIAEHDCPHRRPCKAHAKHYRQRPTRTSVDSTPKPPQADKDLKLTASPKPESDSESSSTKRKSVFSRSKSFAGNLLQTTDANGDTKIRRPSISRALTRRKTSAPEEGVEAPEELPVEEKKKMSLPNALAPIGPAFKDLTRKLYKLESDNSSVCAGPITTSGNSGALEQAALLTVAPNFELQAPPKTRRMSFIGQLNPLAKQESVQPGLGSQKTSRARQQPSLMQRSKTQEHRKPSTKKPIKRVASNRVAHQ